MTRNNERGLAIVLAMMALLMLSTLGAGLVLTSSTEAAISGNFRAATEARYAVRALAERAMADLAGLAAWDPVLGGMVRSSFVDGSPGGTRPMAGGATIDLSAIVNTANCGQAAGCTAAQMNAVTAARPWGANNPRWQLYAWGPIGLLDGASVPVPRLYLVALAGDDGAENDGDPAVDGVAPGNAGAGRLMLRAFAFGPGGIRSGRELTVARLADGRVNVLSIKELP